MNDAHNPLRSADCDAERSLIRGVFAFLDSVLSPARIEQAEELDPGVEAQWFPRCIRGKIADVVNATRGTPRLMTSSSLPLVHYNLNPGSTRRQRITLIRHGTRGGHRPTGKIARPSLIPEPTRKSLQQ